MTDNNSSGQEGSFPEFRSGRRRALIAITLAAIAVAVELAQVGSDIYELRLIAQAQVVGLDQNAAELSDFLQRIGMLVGPFFGLLWFIALLVWTYRGHRNLQSLGATRIKRSSAFAVGCWFIPIGNLVMPFEAMREIWWGSDPKRIQWDPTTSIDYSTPIILRFWWLGFILTWLISAPASNARIYCNTPAKLQIADIADAIGQLITILWTILTIVIVRRITAMQAERILAFEPDRGQMGS